MNEMLQRVEVVPDRVVDNEKRVVDSVYLHIAGGLTVFICKTPHESWRNLGESVDRTQRSDELGDIRMVEGSSYTSDVVLGQMEVRHQKRLSDPKRPDVAV
jgi:hypothetical protein